MNRTADRIALAENASRGLFALVLLFILLIGVIIAFSRAFITTIGGVNSSTANVARIVAVALPLVLLGVTAFQVWRLVRQRSLGRAGAHLRLRLLLFFVFISILSAGPQTLLGIIFVQSAMGTWFSSSIGDALKGARDTTLAYDTEKQQSLAAFMAGTLAKGMVADFAAAPVQAWPGIHDMNRSVDALQLFGIDGKVVAFQGDPTARLGTPPPVGGKRDATSRVTILRETRTYTVLGRTYTAVASSLLPPALRANAPRITESYNL
ncbi:MAG TPA: hypothetical protein VL359_00940, partial [bacterium]|nr:hypothetical protein [bacterium]